MYDIMVVFHAPRKLKYFYDMPDKLNLILSETVFNYSRARVPITYLYKGRCMGLGAHVGFQKKLPYWSSSPEPSSQ
jgi:hypothetical protein